MSQARAADVEKMKLQMMQAMNIKDPKELQRMAREYCKDMAVELTLPAYHRFGFALDNPQLRPRSPR